MDIGDMMNPKLFLLASVIIFLLGYAVGISFLGNLILNVFNFCTWYILYPFVLKQVSRTKDE